ncbi:unnamed protein product [Acanthoscelides obtectus]|uniref:Myeloid differentiation primary response protein MyD88 n=1 Tax=Acanthoscelides obtectus TaxID=200917 RepID=A0A9P0KYY7_ACAOB|nr:unnamed protein product [Acanthoscelides obtectus]CAK1654615.1 Myeloid differentiation primary response protein MyD88 [Acanthoscelides obtectus]
MIQEVASEETEPEDINKTILVNTFSKETRRLISDLLNPKKLIPTDEGFLRDWHGLAELCEIPGEHIPSLERDTDPCNKILDIWLEKKGNESTIEALISFLERIDRFDIIDDITPLVERDIDYYKKFPNGYKVPPPLIDDKDVLTYDDVLRKKSGLPPQIYDAFVLFAEDDIDFAGLLVETLERQYNLKLVLKNRDLVVGVMEHDSVIQLISDRCRRMIVILSPAFLESSANSFLCSFAQQQGIKQGERKIIPCKYKDCELPRELGVYFLLDYSRSNRLGDFFYKLYLSVVDMDALVKNKSMETLKLSANRVKFSSMVNLPISDELSAPPAESASNGGAYSDYTEETQENMPKSSRNSLPCAGDTKLRKKNSIIRKLRQLVQPKKTEIEANTEAKSTSKEERRCTSGRKKTFWKSSKMKVPVAN